MTDDASQDGGRTGRRPGNSGTKEAILDAARERFAEVGFDKASIRSIATAAGVDSALVHHYFGTKQQLFVEVVRVPVDPAIITGILRDAPLESLGETFVRTIVGLWDSPAGVGALAAFRGVLAGGDASLIRTFVVEIALKDVRSRIDSPPGSGTTRIALVASQMFGLLAARKILLLEPLASMSIDQIVDYIAPTLQRYLTGELL